MVEFGQMGLSRSLTNSIIDLALSSGKMAFISGPRQVGKTTLARELLNQVPQSRYENWDQTEFRRTWVRSPSQLLQFNDQSQPGWLVLDEIHKARNWKRTLKGLYDTKPPKTNIIVTGSARLNVYKSGGDSLLGRYFHFRLMPLSLGELQHGQVPDAKSWYARLKNGEASPDSGVASQKTLADLLNLSGFPEPLLSGSERRANLWRRGRIEKIVGEDLRDLSRIQELGQVAILADLLPEKVGSPLSIQSLREDLDVAFDTAKHWLTFLKELYYFFEVRPYVKNISRSLKKEPKIYLYDWTAVREPGPRFENLVAVHLLKSCWAWNDSGQGNFDLFYLRNKEKQEVDFLITESGKPWLSVECKLKPGVDPSFRKFQAQTRCPHVQVVFEPGVFKVMRDEAAPAFEISAGRLLAGLG